MKFKLLETALTEGKNIDITWDKYKDKWMQYLKSIGYNYNEEEEQAKEIWLRDIAIDPTFKNGSNTTGDFGEWLTRMYINGKFNDWAQNKYRYTGISDVEVIFKAKNFLNDILKEFIKKKPNLPKKDINSYKSIEELVSSVETTDYSDRQKERMLRNSKEVELVYQDKYWEIYKPLSYAGSCTLGKGTEWCTAYSGDDSFYKGYTSNGNSLLVIVDRDNPNIKYQYSTEMGEIKDAYDYDVCLEMEFRNHPKLIDFIEKNYPPDVDDSLAILAKEMGTSPYYVQQALDQDEMFCFENAKNYDDVGKQIKENDLWDELGIAPSDVIFENGEEDWEETLNEYATDWIFSNNGNAYCSFW